MRQGKTTLILYWGVVGLCFLVFTWWMVFFYMEGELLVGRIEGNGVELAPDQAEAVRQAANDSSRMLLFEGGFFGLMLLAGMYFVIRSMRREVLLHRQQRDLISAVTHELRSPIASAQLHVESLQLGRVFDEEKRLLYLERAKQNLQRLADMVDRLLEASRFSKGKPELELHRLDLASFTRETLERIAQQKAEGNVEIEIDAPSEVPVEADAAALESILRNLIANAAKYGGDSPKVQVAVTDVDGRAQLFVRDFGPGLRGISAKKLFEPFTRGGDREIKSRPGVGLGLFLVAELTRALGGRVEAHDVEGGHGFAVEISLPLAGAEVGA